MLSRQQLREIAAIKPGTEPYISLYLNVNPLTNPSGEFAIHYKNMLKEAIDRLDKSVAKKIKNGIAAMDSYVLGNKRQFKKGLVILCSGSADFMQVYDLSVPVKNELIINDTPYIKPLLDILDNYKRYAVILSEKDSARIFIVQLGEITEYGAVQSPDVPGRHKKGGWFALSQNHYERHVDFHVSLHMKDVIEHLEGFLKGESIDGLVVGGPDEAVSMMKNSLPKPIAEKVVGSFRAGMYEDTTEILAKVEPVIFAYESRQLQEDVDELITRAEKDKKAVLGLSDVLQAVQEGKVMKLIFVRDLKAEGFACKACSALFAQKTDACPFCKGSLQAVSHIVDFVAQRAVEQGAIVRVVSEENILAQKGGIGAILRF